MMEYKTEGMTCKSCVLHVTRAVQEIDPAAKVEVDLKSQTIRVESEAESALFEGALESAGYPVLERAGERS